MKVLARTLMLLSILMSLGCSKLVKTERIVLMPPQQLMVECVEAEHRKLVVNRDLVNDRNAWKLAYEKCAANNDAIVQWLRRACALEKKCEYGRQEN